MLEVKHWHGDFDHMVIRDVPREYRGVLDRMKGARVLDIGAHIGCFAVLALNGGAKKVVSIEPGSPSVKLLRKNVKPAGDRCEVVHAGIVADDREKIILRYLSHKNSMAGAKTVKDYKPAHWSGIPFTFEDIPTVNFSAMLRKHKPTILKLDCEGMEYDCLESISEMPSHVTTFIAEFHKVTKQKNLSRYIACKKLLRRWGFRPEKDDNLKMDATRQLIRPIAWKR